MPRYALSPADLGDLLHLRGLRLTREADRQRQVLRAAGKPGPCVPLPSRVPLPPRGNPLNHAKVRLIHSVFTPSKEYRG